MRHHAHGHFDWLISGHQSVNPSKEIISILSDKYKRFTFVHPVELPTGWTNVNLLCFPDSIGIASLQG